RKHAGPTQRLDQLESVTRRLSNQRQHAILQCPTAHLADESVRRHAGNVAQASLLRKVLRVTTSQRPGWPCRRGWCILPALEASEPAATAYPAVGSSLLRADRRPYRELAGRRHRRDDQADPHPDADPRAPAAQRQDPLRRR